MKRLIFCAALMGGMAIPMDAISQPLPIDKATATETEAVVDPATPSSPKEVAESVSNLIDATRTGSWITIVGGVIMLLMNLFRLPQLGALTKKIPGRWRLVIAVALGGVGGILASIAGGMPWYEAIAVGLFSGPSAVFAHEAVVNTVMGKRNKNANEASAPSAPA